MRSIGLDVHREFCEVAISEEGRVRSAGRIRTRREELELFARSLGGDDEVALETTGGAVAIASILRPHVGRVVVVNTKRLPQISQAKAKTDRLDARRLAELLAAGFLAEVWCPDERTRALRQPERYPNVMPTCPSREQRRGLVVSEVLIRELAIRGLVHRDRDSDDSDRARRGDGASPSILPVDQARGCRPHGGRCGSRSQGQHDGANPS